jgi:putative ABC transport system permease protein
MEGAFNHLALRLAPGASERAVIAALDTLLEPYGGLNAHGRDEQLSHRILGHEIDQWKVIGTMIPTIFLVVASFLLNVVLGRQVATQREQIAALKALGYANATLVRHYLMQVAVIVALGIGLGVGAGWWFGEAVTGLYAEFFHFPAYAFPDAVMGRARCRDHARRRDCRDARRRSGARSESRRRAMRPPFPASIAQPWMERMGLSARFNRPRCG